MFDFGSGLRGAHSTEEGNLDYEEIARRTAIASDIEGTVRGFVKQYKLADKRILEVGSGRGYLQDIVPGYTGLDIPKSAASRYHKPFVVTGLMIGRLCGSVYCRTA
jgi:hypothetical protein